MNNQFYLILLLFLLLLGSCATTTLNKTIDIPDYTESRKEELYLRDSLESVNPAKGFVAMEHLYMQNRPTSFQTALKYGNYFIDSWPGDERTAAVANRMAWISFFLLTEADHNTRDFFNIHDRNLEYFCRALFYSDISARADRETDRFWTRRASDLVELCEEGYDEFPVLLEYLKAQRFSRIETVAKRDISYTRQSLDILKDIEMRYEEWLPEIIRRDIKLNEDKISSIENR